jgi:hypothetical protein
MTPEHLPVVSPRTDIVGGLVWIVFGSVLVVLSWQMDRFEGQGGTLWTAPGLWPGLIGTLIAILGGVLIARSLVRARRIGFGAAQADQAVLVAGSQFALAVALIFIYALLLVGRGLPFWLATAGFVTVFVFLFRRASGGPSGARAMAFALTCGIVTAAVVSYAFEKLFYVRLP